MGGWGLELDHGLHVVHLNMDATVARGFRNDRGPFGLRVSDHSAGGRRNLTNHEGGGGAARDGLADRSEKGARNAPGFTGTDDRQVVFLAV